MKQLKKQPKTIEEDLASISEEDLLSQTSQKNDKTNKIKKVAIFLTGAILILLILTLVWLQYPIFDILQGQIESEKILLVPDNNTIITSNITVTFTDAALTEIASAYLTNQGKEVAFCLKGNKIQQVYTINETYIPRIFEQTSRKVVHAPCSEDTLILFHTHPYKSCLASETDIATLKNTQLFNPETIMIIMCESERYSVYS